MIIPRVPALKSLSPRFNFKIRYQANAALAGHDILVGDLLDSLCFATNASVGYRTLGAIRIKQIEMWGPQDSTFSPVVLGLIWLSNGVLFGGPTKIISDTSMGATEVAYVKSSPPKGSLASQWFQDTSTQTTPIMEIGFPANAIVDVLFEGVVSYNGLGNVVHTPISGATTGAQYIRALDASAGSLLVPQIVASV
jgi:hypothetical protein